VLLLVGAGIVASFQIGKAPPALPDIRAGLDLGLVAAGWVISIYAFVTAGCGALGGALADAAGHRRAAIFGLICLAVGSAAGAAAEGAALLLAGRFIEGMGYVPIMVSIPALILRAARPDHARLAFGLWGANMPAGTAAMVLAAPLVLPALGWQGLWLANAALAAAYALLFALGTRRLATRGKGLRALAPRPLARDLWSVLRTPAAVALALFYPTYTGNYLAIFGFLPTLLVERMGAAPADAALLTGAAIAVNIVGNLAGGVLRQRGVSLRAVFVGGSAAMGILALAVYAEPLPGELRYAAAVLLSLCAGVVPGAALGAAPGFAPTPQLAATSSGLLAQGASIGMLVWPPALAAVVAAGGGWHAAPWLVTTAAALGVVLGWIAGGFERRGG
jgi:cyanate permease